MSKLDEMIQEYCPNEVEYKPLNEIFSTRNGYTPSKNNKEYWESGDVPWFRMEDIRENGPILSDSIQKVNRLGIKGDLFPENSLIVATSATIGEHALITVPSLANQRFTYLMLKERWKEKFDIKFLFYYCYKLDEWCLAHLNQGSFASVDMKQFASFKFPVPPLEVQREIVRILDNYTEITQELITNLTAELTARRQQYEYYRSDLLSFDNHIQYRSLDELCNISAGGDVPKDAMSKDKSADYPIPIISNGIGRNAFYGYTNKPTITEPAVTVAARGTIGYAEYRDYPFFPIIRLLSLIPKNTSELNTRYLYYSLQGKKYNIPTSGIPQLTAPMLKKVMVPVPPIDTQEYIVNILDKFDSICNDLSEGLPAEIEARQRQYEYYRDKLLSFPELTTA